MFPNLLYVNLQLNLQWLWMIDLIFDQFIDVSLGDIFCHTVHAAIP